MTPKARMKSPALTLPGTQEALQQLSKIADQTGLSRVLKELTNLRASQLNGCSVCVDMHARALRKLGEPEERIHSVAAWRDAPNYSEAERAALALTEAATRLADRADAVPDEIFAEAVRHFDEKVLSGLILSIAAINLWNRMNAIVRQPSGEWTAQFAGV